MATSLQFVRRIVLGVLPSLDIVGSGVYSEDAALIEQWRADRSSGSPHDGSLD